MQDLTNKQINDWTVSKFSHKNKSRYWECICKCGFKKYFTTGYINTNKITCCINCKRKDEGYEFPNLCKKLIGTNVGKWKVLSFDKNNKWGVRYWKCKCECGFERSIPTFYLINNKCISCMKCKGKLQIKKRLEKEIPISNSKWAIIKKNAKKNNYEFNISKEYAWNLFLKQNKKCALSGINLQFSDTTCSDIKCTASLDRIDNSKGYIEGNVQWLHKHINMMKHVYSQNYFIELCTLISDFNKK